MNNYQTFSTSYKTLGSTSAIIPQFKLLHEFSIQTKPYAIPKIAKDFARQEINKLLEAGIIEPSTSNYSFPVIFVKKKFNSFDDSNQPKFRMCIDYRLLNSITEAYKICLPKISDILQNIAGRKVYSVLDLKAAFFQIKLNEEDKAKLAFSTEFGNFHPARLPFGLKNSTSYFHALISKCLDPIKGKNVQYFLDDIIIAADNFNEMKFWLQKVFDRLNQFNLTLDPAKLQLCQSNINYLGFNLNENGYSPASNNIEKITKFPYPKNLKEVQTYLGMINYFRHLIFNFANIITPIVKLTKKGTKFDWNDDCKQAFHKIQQILLSKPTIKNINNNKDIFLVTDASRTAVCGILMQKYDDKFYPIEFFSKILKPSESRYPSIRRELYAIYLSVRHFHEHLYGRSFIILTDAKPLTYHIQLDKQPDIITRWLLYLQGFNYSIQHIPGFSNPADYLSRVSEDSVENLNVNSLTFTDHNENLNVENIRKKQSEDPKLKIIIEKCVNNNNANDKYFINPDNNLLYIKLKINCRKSKKTINRIFIPQSLIKSVLIEAHKPHFGASKTCNLAKRQYYWRGMFRDSKKFCYQCHQCLSHKSKNLITKPIMIPKSHLSPGQMIAIDIIGKLPRSHDNKFFILTVIDHFSRYLVTYALNNITSANIIKCLTDYFSKFGTAKIVLSDNAQNFCSNEMENFFKSLDIEHRKSSIYLPRSNGVSERVNRSLKQSIASLSDQIIEWSDRLNFYTMFYNNVKHSVTNFTPAQLFFGRELRLPIDQISPAILTTEPSEYLQQQLKHIEETKQMVIHNEKEFFSKNSKFLKGTKHRQYQTDDHVYVKEFINKGALMPKFNGPYIITKQLRNDNYIIKNLNDPNEREIKVNICHLYKKGESDEFQPIADNV